MKSYAAIIVFLVSQIGAGIWWASSLSAQVINVELDYKEINKEVKDQRKKIEKITETVIRTEERVASMQSILIDIKNSIEKR